MLLRELNPRYVLLPRPSNTGAAGVVCVELDCPCGCGVPYRILDVPNTPATLPQTQPTPAQWAVRLLQYARNEDVYRVLPSMGCRWIGLIRAGRVRKVDNENEDFDEAERPSVEEVLARIEARRRAREEGQSIRVR